MTDNGRYHKQIFPTVKKEFWWITVTDQYKVYVLNRTLCFWPEWFTSAIKKKYEILKKVKYRCDFLHLKKKKICSLSAVSLFKCLHLHKEILRSCRSLNQLYVKDSSYGQYFWQYSHFSVNCSECFIIWAFFVAAFQWIAVNILLFGLFNFLLFCSPIRDPIHWHIRNGSFPTTVM